MKWSNVIGSFLQLRNAAQFIRDMDSDNMLGYVGLQKKQSTFSTYVLPGIGFFAAGLAAGAGLGLLLAPSSGRELRGQLGQKYSSVKEKIASTTDQLRNQMSSAGEQMSQTVQSGAEDIGNELSPGGNQGRMM
jgi:gas vesicle protein